MPKLGISFGIGSTSVEGAIVANSGGGGGGYSDGFFMTNDSSPEVTLSTVASLADSQSVTKSDVLKLEANQEFSSSYDPRLNLRDGASGIADSTAATVTFSMLLDSGNTGNVPGTFASIRVQAKGGSFVSQPLTTSDITVGEWTDFSVSVTTGTGNDHITFDLDHAGGGGVHDEDIIYFHGVSIS